MAGDPGLELANDLITLFKDKWIPKTGGVQPVFTTQWNIKEVGRGQKKYTNVIIDADVNNPRIFSLQYTVNNIPTWDFYHDISANIDMITSESENRINQISFEIQRILTTNVVPVINTHQYTQLLPGPVIDLNEQYRNIFRKTMIVEAERYNPLTGDNIIT